MNRFRNFSSFLKREGLRYCEKLRFSRHRRFIRKAGLLDSTFACPSWIPVTDPVEWYLNQSQKADSCRKPMPGFHPGSYAEHVDTGGMDPFFHFLKRGQPEGPWSLKVIRPGDDTSVNAGTSKGGDYALHLHLHYHEQARDLLEAVWKSKARPDLKISVTSPEGRDHVLALLRTGESPEADVRIVPNRGRDIGPLLTEFGRDLRRYKVIGHIHAKGSALVSDRPAVDRWVGFLRENLLNGRSPMSDVILGKFERNPRLGLVFPDDPHVIGWTENKPAAEKLAASMGFPAPLPSSINFPVGTMFWARPEALAALFDLDLAWDDYPVEPVAYDGTMLHAIERLLPMIARHAGYECAVTHVPGVSR
jgi:hypothetical protein